MTILPRPSWTVDGDPEVVLDCGDPYPHRLHWPGGRVLCARASSQLNTDTHRSRTGRLAYWKKYNFFTISQFDVCFQLLRQTYWTLKINIYVLIYRCMIIYIIKIRNIVRSIVLYSTIVWRICHLVKWQTHHFISKGRTYTALICTQAEIQVGRENKILVTWHHIEREP